MRPAETQNAWWSAAMNIVLQVSVVLPVSVAEDRRFELLRGFPQHAEAQRPLAFPARL
jgi:hypothetical protein